MNVCPKTAWPELACYAEPHWCTVGGIRLCYKLGMSAHAVVLECISAQLGLATIKAVPRHLHALGAEERPRFLVSAIHLGATALGRHVLQAKDRPDLLIRIDATFERPELAHVVSLVRDSLFQDAATDTEALPLVESILPTEQAERFAEAEPLFAELFRLQTEVARLLDAKGIPLQSPRPQQQTLIERLYATDIPPEVSLLSIRALRADVASLALSGAAIGGLLLNDWRAPALTDVVLLGLRASLQLLASVPGIVADDRIVSAAEKLNLEELTRVNHQVEQGYRMMVLLSEAQGEGAQMPWTPLLDEK